MVAKEDKREYNTINLGIRRQKTKILFLASRYKEWSERLLDSMHT